MSLEAFLLVFAFLAVSWMLFLVAMLFGWSRWFRKQWDLQRRARSKDFQGSFTHTNRMPTSQAPSRPHPPPPKDTRDGKLPA